MLFFFYLQTDCVSVLQTGARAQHLVVTSDYRNLVYCFRIRRAYKLSFFTSVKFCTVLLEISYVKEKKA